MTQPLGTLQVKVPSIITTVNTFDFLEEELKFIDKDTLVIFDIDKVLLVKKDPWERGYVPERRTAKTVSSLHIKNSPLYKTLDRHTRDYLWSIYACANEVELVDHKALSSIKKLQSSSVKIMALTNFILGKIGIIANAESWRIKQLHAKGIHFEYSFPQQEVIVFKQFEKENKSPVFREGILFTGSMISKGEALNAFFNALKWWPKRVVMIDDKMENLISVQENLKTLHIAFKGYEYLGATKLPAFFDKEIAEFQMRYLIEHHKWINAKEAKALLTLSAFEDTKVYFQGSNFLATFSFLNLT